MKINSNEHITNANYLAQAKKIFSMLPASQKITFASGLVLLLMLNVATASISTTKHNLGSTNSLPGNPNKFSGTTEICVFCHTPHGANTSTTNAAPLWNRTFSATSAYTTYDSLGTTTFDAIDAPTGSVSIACLSCHDGTQSMNIMINTPGSGSPTLSGTWSGTNQTSGQINGAFTRIGTDLTNDHPVSIQYGGGGITSASPTGATKDPYFAQAVSGNPAKRVGSTIGQVGSRLLKNGTRVWWVETDGLTGQSKLDLPLYSRTEASVSGGNQPFVECASCHDPHSNNATFLRLPAGNDSSAVCLTCHIK